MELLCFLAGAGVVLLCDWMHRPKAEEKEREPQGDFSAEILTQFENMMAYDGTGRRQKPIEHQD